LQRHVTRFGKFTTRLDVKLRMRSEGQRLACLGVLGRLVGEHLALALQLGDDALGRFDGRLRRRPPAATAACGDGRCGCLLASRSRSRARAS
jgi:hypothetical protein